MRPPGSPAALEKRRRKALELLQQEMMLEAVAKAVKASTSSVKRCRDAFEQSGDGLDSRPHPVPRPRLNAKQKELPGMPDEENSEKLKMKIRRS